MVNMVRAAFNEYPQHMFSWRTKYNILLEYSAYLKLSTLGNDDDDDDFMFHQSRFLT